jgi:superoxide dismutase, Cu-Zn family
VIEEGGTTEAPITTFTVRITGIEVDPTLPPPKLGGHLHTGPCVEGNPTAAGPHYNDQVVKEGKVAPTKAEPNPPNAAAVNASTEVWFEFEPNPDGMAYDTTTVEFTPQDPVTLSDPVPGKMSVVVHVFPTQTEFDPVTGQPAGYAGARQACFPLSVPESWLP